MIAKIYNFLKNFSLHFGFILVGFITFLHYSLRTESYKNVGFVGLPEWVDNDVIFLFIAYIRGNLFDLHLYIFLAVVIIFLYEKFFHKTKLSWKNFIMYAIFSILVLVFGILLNHHIIL